MYELQPFGYEMENYRMARICASVLVAAGAKDVKLQDFYPSISSEPEDQRTDEEFEQGLVAMFRGLSHTGNHE